MYRSRSKFNGNRLKKNGHDDLISHGVNILGTGMNLSCLRPAMSK